MTTRPADHARAEHLAFIATSADGQLSPDAGVGGGQERVARRVARLVRPRTAPRRRRPRPVPEGAASSSGTSRTFRKARRWTGPGPELDRAAGRARGLPQGQRALCHPDGPARGHTAVACPDAEGGPGRSGAASASTTSRPTRATPTRSAWPSRSPAGLASAVSRGRVRRRPTAATTSGFRSPTQPVPQLDDDALLAGMNQQWRRNIRKADKEGVAVRPGHARRSWRLPPDLRRDRRARSLHAAAADVLRADVGRAHRRGARPAAALSGSPRRRPRGRDDDGAGRHSMRGTPTARRPRTKREVRGSNAVQWRMMRDAPRRRRRGVRHARHHRHGLSRRPARRIAAVQGRHRRPGRGVSRRVGSAVEAVARTRRSWHG